jgi:DNA modification methylase
MSYKILNGDSAKLLQDLPDNSIDAIVTDPPYLIGFLDKAWDHKDYDLFPVFEECLRVLKPGGHILAFSAARTYHHLAITLEQAGFEIRDQIMWIYSSGFPKSQDIGKSIQRGLGVEETKKNPNARSKAGDSIYDGGFQKDTAGEDVVCTDPLAQKWLGWGTQLKPAHEPICLARKPIKQSIAKNCQEWGTGAVNIDATRIPGETLEYPADGMNRVTFNQSEPNKWAGDTTVNDQGRFPSNVLGEIEEAYQKYFYCPKVSKLERQEYNNHPTVKPIELMKYLIKLITPPGGTVLDPFNGSGTTGMAAVELGFDYIGCELDPSYVEISIKRIEAWRNRGCDRDVFEELFTFE